MVLVNEHQKEDNDYPNLLSHLPIEHQSLRVSSKRPEEMHEVQSSQSIGIMAKGFFILLILNNRHN